MSIDGNTRCRGDVAANPRGAAKAPEERAALVDAARAGDRVALERLLLVCQPDIRRFARSQCSEAGDVDDAVQESLWIVYRRIGGLRTAAAFPGWLFAIVQRECRRLWRRMRRQPTVRPSVSVQPEPALQADYELRQDLLSAIESLPHRYRTVIILRDLRELTIAEIADELRLTREAVKSRIHRGRLMVREYLES